MNVVDSNTHHEDEADLTITSTSCSHEEESTKSYDDDNDDDVSRSCRYSTRDEDESGGEGVEVVMGNRANNNKNRLSSSKELLKPTREGSLIKAGVDPAKHHHDSAIAPNPSPMYAKPQLKVTGFGDKVKQGADIPRDHISQPVDPNAKLGDVYRNVQATKFKKTGFGEKVKQGADFPREHIPQPEDPNAKLGDLYKSVHFKATGYGDKLKQGQDIIQESRRVDDSNCLPSDMYRSVHLKKASSSNLDEEKTKKRRKSGCGTTALPKVVLHKTTPIVKEAPRKFELPEEFSIVKQNLKHLEECDKQQQLQACDSSNKGTKTKHGEKKFTSSKWFLCRGEWIGGSGDEERTESRNANTSSGKKSWFMGGSSSLKVKHPHKLSNQHQPCHPSKLSFLGGGEARHVFIWMVLVAVTLALLPASYYYSTTLQQAGIELTWKQMQLDTEASIKRTKLCAVDVVDRVCKGINETFSVTEEHRYARWMKLVRTNSMAACSFMQKGLGMASDERMEEESNVRSNFVGSTRDSAPNKDVNTPVKAVVSKSSSEQKSGFANKTDREDCIICQSKPKWLRRVLRYLLQFNKHVKECCAEPTRG